MNIVPLNKHDFETCDLLDTALDNVVSRKIPELLEWLQDMNWPVFERVADRLSKLDEQLVEPISEILNGNDEIWKYCLISGLFPRLNKSIVKRLHPLLVRIASEPTETEKLEEVNIVAKEVLCE